MDFLNDIHSINDIVTLIENNKVIALIVFVVLGAFVNKLIKRFTPRRGKPCPALEVEWDHGCGGKIFHNGKKIIDVPLPRQKPPNILKHFEGHGETKFLLRLEDISLPDLDHLPLTVEVKGSQTHRKHKIEIEFVLAFIEEGKVTSHVELAEKTIRVSRTTKEQIEFDHLNRKIMPYIRKYL